MKVLTRNGLQEYVSNVVKNTLQNVLEKISNSAQENVLINIMNRIKYIMKQENVFNVGLNLKLKNQNPNNVVPVSVLQIHESGNNPVYNLLVYGSNEYFANGILVHNCDALVWTITELEGKTPLQNFSLSSIATTRFRG